MARQSQLRQSETNTAGGSAANDHTSSTGSVRTSFSLRSLLTLSVLFAFVFGIISYVGHDWSTRQLLTFLIAICGWSALIGVVLYLALWKQRRIHQQLGRRLLRLGGPVARGWSRKSLIGCNVTVFALWVGYVAFVIGTDEQFDGSAIEWASLAWMPLNVLFIQLTLLVYLFAPPCVLEVFEQGLFSRIFGAHPFDEFQSTRWSQSQKQSVLVVVLGTDGAGSTFSLALPKDCRADVDRILTSKLGDRHTPAA